MKVTIDIPDKDAERVIGGSCRKWKYQEKVKGPVDVKIPDPDPKAKEGATVTVKELKEVPNPQSRVDFVKERLISFWMNEVRIQEREDAKVASDKAVDESVAQIKMS